MMFKVLLGFCVLQIVQAGMYIENIILKNSQGLHLTKNSYILFFNIQCRTLNPVDRNLSKKGCLLNIVDHRVAEMQIYFLQQRRAAFKLFSLTNKLMYKTNYKNTYSVINFIRILLFNLFIY